MLFLVPVYNLMSKGCFQFSHVLSDHALKPTSIGTKPKGAAAELFSAWKSAVLTQTMSFDASPCPQILIKR